MVDAKDVFVILFVAFTCIYMYSVHMTLSKFDIVMLVIGLCVLLFTLYKFKSKKLLTTTETYENNTAATPPALDASRFSEIAFEEDLTVMVPICSVYITTFNKQSYPEEGQEWFNVAYKVRDDCSKLENKKFTFEHLPMFTRMNGLLLATNRLFGPFSNLLNISLQNTFTIFMAVKHGDFLPSNQQEIEFLKLYANSNDNNGLSLFIENNSISVENNVQSGNLLFKFVDNAEPIKCVVNPQDTNIVFDKTNLSLYFIVKDIDKVRILYMSGNPTTTTIREIARLTIQETSATFSNKELVINRFGNWKANIYNFGVINEAISDATVSSIHSHIASEYLKATSQEYLNLSNDYNDLLAYVRRFASCPYDQSVCSTCTTITQWNDATQVMTSPPDCKDAINRFCRANTKHALCRCWDNTYGAYNSEACILYRKMFDPNINLYDNLSQNDLNYIKQKYKLLYLEECPKQVAEKETCTNTDLIKNTYREYDFEKMKVRPEKLKHVSSSTFKVQSPYSDEKLDFSDKDKMISESESASSSTTQKTSESEKMFQGENNQYKNEDSASVINYYQQDGATSFNQAKNQAFTEYDRSVEIHNTTNNNDTIFNRLFSVFLPSS